MSTQEKKTVIGLPLVALATADEPAQLLGSGMVLGLYNVHHGRNDENKETKEITTLFHFPSNASTPPQVLIIIILLHSSLLQHTLQN